MLTKNLGLAGTGVPPPHTPAERKTVFGRAIGLAVIVVLSAVSISTGYLTIERFTFLIGILIPAAYFIVMECSPKSIDVERSRLVAYIPLFIAAMMFWAICRLGTTKKGGSIY